MASYFSRGMNLSKAGIVELAASLMVFTMILTSLGLIMERNRTSNDSIKMWEICGITDRAQAFILDCAYVDPASGNIYPIIDAKKSLTLDENSTTIKLGDSDTMFQFPTLVLRFDKLSIIELKVAEKCGDV